MKLNELILENDDDWNPATDLGRIKQWLLFHNASVGLHKNAITMNSDGTIDIHQDFSMSNARVRRFPDFIRIRNVYGNFSVSNCDFRTMEGFPQYVKGDFYCTLCRIDSLKGGPTKVDGTKYDVSGNRLKNLHGAPEIINGDFNCADNDLESLEGQLGTVNGNFNCSNNELKSFKGNVHTVGCLIARHNKSFEDLTGIHDTFKKIDTWIDLANSGDVKKGGLGLLLVPVMKDVLFEPHGACEIVRKYLTMPNKEDHVFDCQAELVDAGYEELAQL